MATADGPPEGQGDNSGRHPHGATVNETGRPVVVSLGLEPRIVIGLASTVRAVYDPRFASADAAANGEFYDADAGTKWAGIFHGPGTPRRRAHPMAKLAHSGREDRKPDAPLSPEGQKIADRKARKAAEREERARIAAEAPQTPPRKKPRGRRPGAAGFLDALKAA